MIRDGFKHAIGVMVEVLFELGRCLKSRSTVAPANAQGASSSRNGELYLSPSMDDCVN